MRLLPEADLDAAKRLLSDSGYSVLERRQSWHECLLLRPGERWIGYGLTADEAFADALQACFPSQAARELLRAAVEAAPRATERPAATPDEPPPAAVATSPASVVDEEVGAAIPALPATPFSHDTEQALSEAQALAEQREPPHQRIVSASSTDAASDVEIPTSGTQPLTDLSTSELATAAAAAPAEQVGATPPATSSNAAGNDAAAEAEPAGHRAERIAEPSLHQQGAAAAHPPGPTQPDATPAPIVLARQQDRNGAGSEPPAEPAALRQQEQGEPPDAQPGRIVLARQQDRDGAGSEPSTEPAAPRQQEQGEPPDPRPAPLVLARVQERIGREEADDRASPATELDQLEERIACHRRTLAVASPERQRLVILGWLAQARACQDEEPGLTPRVSRLVRDLRTLSTRWWPGMIGAFRRDCQPAEASRDLRVLGPAVYLTWRDVGEATAEALELLEEDDRAFSRDAAGWADEAKLFPAPTEPAALAGELQAELEDHGGDLFGQQPREASVDPESLLCWVRHLRWLRGACDDELWGALAGRLRFLVSRSPAAVSTEARESLDPAFRPARSWASLVRTAAQVEQEEADLARARANVPSPDADKAEILEWLGLVLPLTTNHEREIVELALPLKVRIYRVEEADVEDDRRIRRRLHKLQKALAGEKELPEAPTGPTNVVQQPAGLDATAARIPDALQRHLDGSRVLCVSNRNDRPLLEKLEELFAFGSVEWAEASPRRLEAKAQSISGGRYDLVLGITGFLDHAADGTLHRACKRAGIPYVRSDKGRPTAVLDALVRELAQQVA